MDGPSLDDRSRRLLGAGKRLHVAAMIARQPREGFRTKAIVQSTGLDQGIVSKEIGHFRDLGLLERVRHGEHRRRVDSFWQACDEIYREHEPTTRKRVSDLATARRRRSRE